MLDELIIELCPNSRQRSLAITSNEQTAMWAIKSVIFNDPESIVEVQSTDSIHSLHPESHERQSRDYGV